MTRLKHGTPMLGQAHVNLVVSSFPHQMKLLFWDKLISQSCTTGFSLVFCIITICQDQNLFTENTPTPMAPYLIARYKHWHKRIVIEMFAFCVQH